MRALARLIPAGYHLGLGLELAAPTRQVVIATPRPHFFPPASAIAELIECLFTRVEAMFERARSLWDDKHVAAFAAYARHRRGARRTWLP